MNRRVVSVWFQRLPSERVLRARPTMAPFALSQRQSNTERVYCLNAAASAQGLQKGMGLGEARVLCPNLQTAEAAPEADAHFLQVLARWATYYCPWVAIEPDGLALDITGSAHLRGGEAPLLEDISSRLARAGLTHRLGLADTYGAAWALARFGQNRPPMEAKVTSMPAARTGGATAPLAQSARGASPAPKQPSAAFLFKMHPLIWLAQDHVKAGILPPNTPSTTQRLHYNTPPFSDYGPPPYPAQMRRTTPRLRRGGGATALVLVSPSLPAPRLTLRACDTANSRTAVPLAPPSTMLARRHSYALAPRAIGGATL